MTVPLVDPRGRLDRSSGYLGVPHVLERAAALPHYFDALARAGVRRPRSDRGARARAAARGDSSSLLMAVSVAVGGDRRRARLPDVLSRRPIARDASASSPAARRTASSLQQVLRRRALRRWCSSAARCCCRASAAWFDQHVIDGIVNGCRRRRCVRSRGSTGFFDNLRRRRRRQRASPRPPGRSAAACAASRPGASTRISTSSWSACWAASSCGGRWAAAS